VLSAQVQLVGAIAFKRKEEEKRNLGQDILVIQGEPLGLSKEIHACELPLKMDTPEKDKDEKVDKNPMFGNLGNENSKCYCVMRRLRRSW